MVKKTLNLHVFLNLAFVATVSTSFNLWMSRGGVNTFAIVIIFLNEFWNVKNSCTPSPLRYALTKKNRLEVELLCSCSSNK